MRIGTELKFTFDNLKSSSCISPSSNVIFKSRMAVNVLLTLFYEKSGPVINMWENTFLFYINAWRIWAWTRTYFSLIF